MAGMTHALHRLGRFAVRRPWLVIGSWLAVAAVVIAAGAAFGRSLHDTYAVPDTDSQQAADLLRQAGSDRDGLTAQVVVTPARGGFRDADAAGAGARAALGTLELRLRRLPHVSGTSRALSPDGRMAVLRLQYPRVEDAQPADLHALERVLTRSRTAGSPLRIEAGGDLYGAFEEGAAGTGEIIGLVAAIIVLVLAFGSLIAMALPIGTALLGLAAGVGSLSLLTYLVAIPTWVPQLGSMIGLGVGIDYALLLVTRHREHLAAGSDVEEAAGRAVATAGRAVLFAGGTVVVAILGLTIAGIPFLTAGGIGIALIVLVMVMASLTLVPAFLGLAGTRIGRRRSALAAAAGVTRWERWGRHVARHAVVYATGGTLLLLALAGPVLALRLGSPDEGNLPTSRTERRAYDLVTQSFGPGANGPLVVAVDTAGGRGLLDRVRAAIAADRGIASVAPSDARGRVATLVAYPATAPQDAATVATVRRLRDDVLPAALRGTPAHAHVGGQTALWADIGERVDRRLPVVLVAVVALAFLLLTVVFRSVVVPLKAAVLNLLSVGAAYGVLVAVFQWGWGAGLIGVQSTVPIVPFIPLFLFAILFGLSMDYEVFLLSRIREHYDATGDNHASIVRGVAGTARVITSAALIMISVFGAFVLDADPTIKMFGLGLATAILLDATVVRLMLVPATMSLLGERNWWMPRPLRRLLPARTPEAGAARA
jgi:RND superfamily putative drug exporter